MTKKTLNQNAKYAQELLKAAEPDFVFNDKPINRLKVVDNNISSNNFSSLPVLSLLLLTALSLLIGLLLKAKLGSIKSISS